jgi:hypothetical protein
VAESEFFSWAALDPQISGVSWGTVRLVLGVGDMPVLVTVMRRICEQQYLRGGRYRALLTTYTASLLRVRPKRKKMYNLKSIILAMLLSK